MTAREKVSLRDLDFGLDFLDLKPEESEMVEIDLEALWRFELESLFLAGFVFALAAVVVHLYARDKR